MRAAKGAKIAHQQVVQHKAVTDIEQDLGLQEMSDSYDPDSDYSGGSRLSEESAGGSLSSDLFSPKRLRLSRFYLTGAKGVAELTNQPKKHLITAVCCAVCSNELKATFGT